MSFYLMLFYYSTRKLDQTCRYCKNKTLIMSHTPENDTEPHHPLTCGGVLTDCVYYPKEAVCYSLLRHMREQETWLGCVFLSECV